MYRVVVDRGSKALIKSRSVLTWQQTGRSLHNRVTGQAPREAGFGKVLIVLSPLAIGGGIVTYAKYDDGFRKTLVANVPAVEPALNFFLQDEPVITKKLEETKETVMGFFASNDTPKKKAEDVAPPLAKKKFDVAPPKEPEMKPKPVAASVPMPEAVAPPPPPPVTASKPAEKVEKVVEKAPTKAAPAPVPVRTPSPAPVAAKSVPVAVVKPTVSADTNKLESEIQTSLKAAIGEYQKAIRVLTAYNEDVKKIVDGSIEKVEEIPWNQLKNKTAVRDNAVAAAEAAANAVNQTLANIEKSLKEKKGPIESEETVRLQNEISSVKNQLNVAKVNMFKAKELSDMSEKYWRKVEAARGFFVQEIENLFPDFNVTDKNPKLSKEELDLFTMYAYSHVLAYQKELQKMQVEGEHRLQRALDNLKSEDLPNIEAQLEYYLEKEKRELNLENQKKLLRMREEGESRIRETLKKQAEAHVDHLNEAIKLKEQEMKRIFERELDDKLLKEQNSYKAQLAAYLGKLKGMESAMKARADADKSAHQSQALWVACQSLWSGVKNGAPGKSWKESLRPLDSEIKAVAKAAEGDEFVKTVLEAVPKAALERGVYPEEALRERFVKVDQLARRLAMVKDDKAKLPMFILSYVQSMFILTPANAISKEELKDEIVDFGKLDTYDILNRAKYWMERGNLTQTLKYVNLLQGAPRKVAQDWLNEARLLLETQQIVNTLMAHAASSGLVYL